MTTQAIIDKTINTIKTLPANKIEEVADFVDYISNKHQEHILNFGIKKLLDQSNTFEFLKDEEDLYNVGDIKEKY